MVAKQVLLVEDDRNDQELAVRALRKTTVPCEVDVLSDGDELVDYLFATGANKGRGPAHTPDLIFLDLKMPKMGGLEVLKLLQRMPATHRSVLPPVVVLTASNEERDVIEAYRFGAHSYVRKSVDFTEFVHAIRQTANYWLAVNEPPPLRTAGLSRPFTRRDVAGHKWFKPREGISVRERTSLERLQPVLSQLEDRLHEELKRLEDEGKLPSGELEPADLVDDVLVQFLDGSVKRPPSVSLERWVTDLLEQRLEELEHGRGSPPLSEDSLNAYPCMMEQPCWLDAIDEGAEKSRDSMARLGAYSESDRIGALMRKLPQQRREAFVLHALQDLDSHEIAKIQGRPEGKVRDDLAIARAFLQAYLGGSLPSRRRGAGDLVAAAVQHLEVALSPTLSPNWEREAMRILLAVGELTEALVKREVEDLCEDRFFSEVRAMHPELERCLDLLCREYRQLVAHADAVRSRIVRHLKTGSASLNNVRSWATELLVAIRDHLAAETDLAFEAFYRDIGGGG